MQCWFVTFSPPISYKSIRAEGCQTFSFCHQEIKCSGKNKVTKFLKITVASIALEAQPDIHSLVLISISLDTAAIGVVNMFMQILCKRKSNKLIIPSSNDGGVWLSGRWLCFFLTCTVRLKLSQLTWLSTSSCVCLWLAGSECLTAVLSNSLYHHLLTSCISMTCKIKLFIMIIHCTGLSSSAMKCVTFSVILWAFGQSAGRFF